MFVVFLLKVTCLKVVLGAFLKEQQVTECLALTKPQHKVFPIVSRDEINKQQTQRKKIR